MRLKWEKSFAREYVALDSEGDTRWMIFGDVDGWNLVYYNERRLGIFSKLATAKAKAQQLEDMEALA